MKLAITQVEEISKKILANLKEENLIILKADEELVLSKIVSAFLADLRAEDDLDREVEGLISGHAAEMDSEGADYRKLFNMVKGKLVRERELIL